MLFESDIEYVTDKLNEKILYKDITARDLYIDMLGMSHVPYGIDETTVIWPKKKFPLWTEIKDVKKDPLDEFELIWEPDTDYILIP